MRAYLTLALSAALLVGAAPVHAKPRHAEAPPATTILDVQAELDANHISAARRMITPLVAKSPKDATLQYFAASIASQMGLLDEAEGHLQTGLAANPKDADLHGFHGRVAQERGDDDVARKEVAAALALDPTQADALSLKGELDLFDRASTGRSPSLAAGSTAARVQQFVKLLGDRAPSAEVATMIDPTILANLPAGISAGASDLPAMIDGLYAAADMQMNSNNFKFAAWEVQPPADGADPDDTVVNVIIERTNDASTVAKFRQMYADPTMRAMIDAETVRTLDGVDDADRELVFQGMAGRHIRTLATVDVKTMGNGASARITDVVFNGISVRDQLVPSVMQLASLNGGSPYSNDYSPSSYTPNYAYSGSSSNSGRLIISIVALLIGLGSMAARRMK